MRFLKSSLLVKGAKRTGAEIRVAAQEEISEMGKEPLLSIEASRERAASSLLLELLNKKL